MARVVREVNSLANIRFAINPSHSGAAEHLGNEGECWDRNLFHGNWETAPFEGSIEVVEWHQNVGEAPTVASNLPPKHVDSTYGLP